MVKKREEQKQPAIAQPDMEIVDLLGTRLKYLNELLLRREKMKDDVIIETYLKHKSLTISPVEVAYNSLCLLIEELSKDITNAIKEGGGKQQLIVKMDSYKTE